MKKLALIFAMIVIAIGLSAQDGQILKKNFNIQKGTPTMRFIGTTPHLNFENTGAVIDWYDSDLTLTHSANTLTLAGGKLTMSGGYSLPSSTTHFWAVGGSTVLATAGTDVACANGTRFWTELYIPVNTTITGISYLVGSVGGTDSVVVQLCNSAGVEVATSRSIGESGNTAANIVGTTAQFQSVAFDEAYSATAGVYYVVLQFNGTTAKFRAYPIAGSPFVAGSVAGTWGTKANITPGTTFTADKGPICITY